MLSVSEKSSRRRSTKDIPWDLSYNVDSKEHDFEVCERVSRSRARETSRRTTYKFRWHRRLTFGLDLVFTQKSYLISGTAKRCQSIAGGARTPPQPGYLASGSPTGPSMDVEVMSEDNQSEEVCSSWMISQSHGVFPRILTSGRGDDRESYALETLNTVQ